MSISKGALSARKLLIEIGFQDLSNISIEDIVWARGAYLRYLPLKNADGRIVFGEKSAIITINSEIEYEGRKRFTIAHELGHYEMHRDLFQYHNDDFITLDCFKEGNQENEANQFASELLIPEELFLKEIKERKFNPALLKELSNRFLTSLTSVSYKYLEFGPHPICIFYCKHNQVIYWKKSEGFKHFITDRIKLKPPEDSVATEYFEKGTIYKNNEVKQPIWKSTWCTLNHWEKDQDYKFFEYCIITPQYDTVLSIVWEE
jgi:Zn-dependent peptidase ImmA (M78 family)